MFDKLPTYFRRNDSYKDTFGRGLLERYLEIFGDELDEDIIPELEAILDIVDAQIAPSRFLTHLSDTLGNPPDLFINEPQYRNILSFILDFYKLKGTKQGYEFFFGLFGFNIVITELPYNEAYYDDGNLYDTPNAENDYLYDNQCPTCTCYTIEFINRTDSMGNISPIGPNDLTNIIAAIEFTEPINAILCGLIQIIEPLDIVNTCIEETITIYTIDNILYDEGELYDDSHTYDESGTTILDIATAVGDACITSPGDYNEDFNNDFNI